MKRIPFLLLLLAFGAMSCVTDDWDDYDDDGYYGYYDRRPDDYRRYERRPPPPPDDRYDRYRDDRRRDRYRDDRRRDRYRDDRDDRRDRDDPRDRPPAVKAPKGYALAGSFQAGKAVECGIPTSKRIQKVRIVGVSGSVSVNTVVLREGSAKTPFPVTRRVGPGETAEIDLGGARQATGLRISAGGKGSYNVYVR